MLTLAEDLTLLALTDAGDVVPAAQPGLDNAVAGALVLDLALAGRARLEGGALVAEEGGGAAPAGPTGEPLLDALLARIAGEAPPSPPQAWIGRLAGEGALRAATARLCERGILREQRDRTLVVFHRTRHPVADGAPEAATRERLRAALLGEGDVAPRDAALASLVGASGLLGELLPDAGEQARATARLQELRAAGAGSLDDAVRAANAATLDALMLAVLTATTAAITAATTAAVTGTA